MKKILFTPVGMTDPITNLRDGSMLHICRVYQPDEVILYMSSEVIEYHNKDNRYVYCIEKLSEQQKHPMKVSFILRPELKDVQDYDIFYDDFHMIIGELMGQMDEDDELLVNVASGTPAMKSALLIMSVLAEYRFRAIQVATPVKKSNPRQEDKENYDVELNWELDEDNSEPYENRCSEPKTRNFHALLLKNSIRKLVASYDYEAAVSMAQEIREYVSEEAMVLMMIGRERLRLNTSMVDCLKQKVPYDLIPIKTAGQRTVFEYALSLKIKTVKGEYADFVRALTPLAADLIEMILKEQCHINLDQYCYITKQGVRKFDERKLKGTKVEHVLLEEFGDLKAGFVATRQMAPLIIAFSDDDELKENVKNIMDIEQKVRNLTAHEVVSVTPEWIKKKSGFTVEQILKIIRYFIKKVGICADEEKWRSFETMNQYIYKELDR